MAYKSTVLISGISKCKAVGILFFPPFPTQLFGTWIKAGALADILDHDTERLILGAVRRIVEA